jgi:hypothetical protein
MPHTHSALPASVAALKSLHELSTHGSHWRAPLPDVWAPGSSHTGQDVSLVSALESQ